MPLPTGDTIGILADNLSKRKSVLPIPAKNAAGWAEGLELPRGGKTVIYTGMMYQLMPYISAMSRAQSNIEDSWLVNFTGVGRRVNKVINISSFMARPDAGIQAYCTNTLRNIVLLLQQAGIKPGYLYDDELYSGALVYDLGADDIFEHHVQRVYHTFKNYGVENVITVDPHTTHMLRFVYPSLIKEYRLNVKSYLEVLLAANPEPVNRLETEVAIHDSCIYARSEGILDEPRILMQKAGIAVKEPADAGKFTRCCGSPVESLFPRKAGASAKNRIEQLQKVTSAGVTMCPLCYVNLHRSAGREMNVDDIANYLIKAYVK